MQHTNFQGHRPFGSREDDVLRCYHVLAWRNSWLFELDRLIKLAFTNPVEAPHNNLTSIGHAVYTKKKFENVESECPWTKVSE